MQQPYLEIRTPQGDFSLPLRRGPLTVGRHVENQLVVNDKLVSRFHCVIDCTPDGYVVRDLGASNPTVVNGLPVKSAVLMDGDVVALGSTKIVMVIPGGSPPEPCVETDEETPTADLAALARAAGESAEPRLSEADLSALTTADLAAPFDEIETLTDADVIDLDEVGLLNDGRIAHIPIGVETLTDADIVDDLPPVTRGDVFTFTRGERMPGRDEPVIPVIASEGSDHGIIGTRGRRPDVDASNTYRRDLRILAENATNRSYAARDIVLLDRSGRTVSSAQGGLGDLGRETVDLFREILLVAFRSRATDIHLDPKGSGHLLRLRIDGVMMDAASLPQVVGERVGRLVKVASGIDPMQRGVTAEGRFAARVPRTPDPTNLATARTIHHQVSFAQTLAGQKMVVRIVDPTGAPARINELKLPGSIEAELLAAARPEPGLVLVCGPAGSGKTTTLYAIVRSIDHRRRNVVSLEDPVETPIEGISQLPVNPELGQSFPTLLRTVLRHDPDVILISEIRDSETARLATQAAASGRLVLAGIHASDPFTAIGRLVDMGIDRYLLGQGLRFILFQDLVRELCSQCKVKEDPPPQAPDTLLESGAAVQDPPTFYRPKGCPACFDTGYSGRRAVCEMLVAGPTLRAALRQTNAIEEHRETIIADANAFHARGAGLQAMLRSGQTSIAEVSRLLR